MMMLPPSKITKNQVKKIEKVVNDKLFKIRFRFDDEFGNGHNSFAMTADWDQSFGCLHEDIAKHFPELDKYIKWHLTSTDGPMYYLKNSMYHASKRDCWGLLKGQPKTYEYFIKVGDALLLDHNDFTNQISFMSEGKAKKYCQFHNKTFSYTKKPKTFGEGKEPDLKAARESAVWPEAEEKDFTEEKLNARLPWLMGEFKKAMEELGFEY